MHENIDNRITELKEIALQIYKAIEQKNYGCFPYAQTKLLALTDGRVAKEIPMRFRTIAEGYDEWITKLLIDLQYWRGSDARQYKALLKEYQAYFQGKSNTGRLAENTNPMWQAIRGIGD